jgi:hypothetical protein
MPKSIPTNGQANWGTALNSHLGQLNEPTNGGINFAATAPTGLTANDVGYTFVDTTNKEIRRWDGTKWVTLMGGVSTNTKLTADLFLYVSQAGNDSNDGLTAATAFKTIDKAVSLLPAIDQNNYLVVIQLADSATPYKGSTIPVDKLTGNLEIRGNTSTPPSVVINAGLQLLSNSTRYAGFWLSGLGSPSRYVRFNGMKIINTKAKADLPSVTSNVFIEAYGYGYIIIDDVEFGTMTDYASWAVSTHVVTGGGSVTRFGRYSISGSVRHHADLSGSDSAGGWWVPSGTGCTIVGNPNISIFLVATSKNNIQVGSTYNFSGASTGTKFSVSHWTLLVGSDRLPGHAAGIAGQYCVIQ